MQGKQNKDSLAKAFVAVLTGKQDLFGDVLADLEMYFGKSDFVGEWHKFSHSDYYEPEMGKDLYRRMVSFEKLLPAWKAGDFKAWTNEVEEKYKVDGKRIVNLDAGYVDNLKVTLISGKCGGHKISIQDGVWVDVLLWYNKGWQAFPWAFPDFRDGTYEGDFLEIRKKFKKDVNLKS